MKKFVALTILMALWGGMPAWGTEINITINPQFQAATGTSDFDAFLQKFNVVAGNKLTVFITDLSATYQVPAKDIHFLIYEEKVQPADALLILQLVRVTGQPVNQVIKKFRKYRKKGWGAIALAYGIKPGTQNWLVFTQNIPSTIWKYEVVEVKGSKGSKAKKGSKGKKKGSKHKKKGSKHKK